MYTLSYSHSLHANTGSEGSARRAGGLVTPIHLRFAQDTQSVPAGARPREPPQHWGG